MNFSRNFKIGFSLCAIFAAGVVIGAILTKQYSRQEPMRRPPFDNWSTKTMQLLQGKLNLSAEQQPKIKAILEDTEKEFQARHCQEVIERGQIVERAQQRVDQELTPEQRKLHSDLIAEFRAKDRARHKSFPPRP
ncbi:MAG: hypothetical protein HY043_21725 [Verrucomicrobia bacterium]|nr:hypothetical protein [Verrucomicrobiota bacterium]